MKTSVILITGQEFFEDHDTPYTIGIFDYGVRVLDGDTNVATIWPWHMVRRVHEEEWV